MKRYWYKTYVEDVFSKTRMQLPDWLFRRLIEFEAFAADLGEDGLLPPVVDMAWILRPVDETKLSEALLALSQVGEVELTPDGGWRLTHFETRQERVSDAERTRQSRLRRAYMPTRNKSLHKSDGIVTEDVTNRDSEVTDVVTTSSTSSSESDSEGGGVGEGEVMAAYQDNIGMLTTIIAQKLQDDIDQYSVNWVMLAIQRAVEKEKRSLAYVEGILKGWKRDGLTDPATQSGKRAVLETRPAIDETRIETTRQQADQKWAFKPAPPPSVRPAIKQLAKQKGVRK